MKNFARFGLGNDITKPVGYAFTTTDRIGPVTLQFENHGTGVANSYITDNQNIRSQNNSNIATVAVKAFVPTIDPVTGLAQQAADGSLMGAFSSTIVANFTIAPGGRVNKNAVIFAKRIAIFGSGLTTISLEIPYTHAAALRGSHIDIEPVGRQGFGFDAGIDSTQMFPFPLS
jgi:hypothetical protein